MSNQSVFDSRDFVKGFIEFESSADYQKYMKPFLKELIDVCRDKLEMTTEPAKYQARLSAIRKIDNMGDMLRAGLLREAKGE